MDLHPEELLDTECFGAEAARLERHARACTACRFEIAVRLDFQADLQPEPVPDSSKQFDTRRTEHRNRAGTL